MKKITILFILFCGILFAGTVSAQTYFYQYQYTKTPDGAKINDRDNILGGYSIMTFSNNYSFVQLTDRQGISKTNSGYRYSYAENGFNVYTPGHSGGNPDVNRLSDQMSNAGLQGAFGWYPIAVSFGNNYNTMLVHQSNGSNQVWQRTSDPSRPNINY